ncbi:hypothetical protein GE300_03320 [Rhodobacteraceae bacterium 2CG4]|uniref:Glycosyltransferase involved in cell wall biosynthesis n=1 Tax=Halovulum marinum TaxID=2662447 RepID=A0A6L5YXF4_9RHOB|nr:glycosyltransferase [Halovulum marinum]MSU88649.1 hypothetical protein [Halovulum marinum]
MASARLWVLGSFALTGGAVPCHAAACVAGAAEAGAAVTALVPQPGAFGHAVIGAQPPDAGADGIIYLKVLRRPPESRRLRGWLVRLLALRRQVRAARRVVAISERRPPAAHRLVLRLLLGRGVVLADLATPAAAILSRCLGLPAPTLAPDRAEATCFNLLATAGAELRLTEQHVARALAGPAGRALPEHARHDILELARAARRLSARTVEAAARHGRLRPGPALPRALRIALGPDPDYAPTPRIAVHLRHAGKRRRHWRRFLPGPPPPEMDLPGPEGVLLRALAGRTAPDDAETLAALDRPLGPGLTLSRGDWLLMLALRLPAERHDSLSAPWACPFLAATLATVRPDPDTGTDTGAGTDTGTAPARRAPRPPALHLVGIAGNATGLAQNFWMSAAALREAGISPRLEPVDAGAAAVAALPAPPDGCGRRLVRSATLYHLNADRIPQQMLARGARAGDGPQIGFLLWELDRLPATHRLALQMLDEIWVPTVFLKRVYQRCFDRPVTVVRKGIALPPPAPVAGPPAGVSRFLICFDARSSVARKNPLAGVRAFQAAFAGRTDVELVVKTTPAPPAHWGDPEGQMAAIARAAAVDPRIRIDRRMLPFPELLGLIASADALVSPHRAEGFGYLPAWALALGVPVVATDHSGSRDFCTPLTAEPVAARLVPVPRSQAIWPCPGARWAEVEPDALTAALRRVAGDPAAARRQAAAGRLVIESDYSLAAQAARYADRLSHLGVLEPAAPIARAAGLPQDAPAEIRA